MQILSGAPGSWGDLMQYDPRTAMTFLLAGIGLGALVTLIVAPGRPKFPVSFDRRTHKRRQEPACGVPYNRRIA